MIPRTVCFVSDRTGITSETLGQALLAQFEGVETRTVTMPFVSTREEARGVVERINAIARTEKARPIIFSTLVDDDVRALVKEANGFFLDFFDAFLAPLEAELEVRSAHITGHAIAGAAADPAHSARIDATNFALANDDGSGARDYRGADLILIGVSRTSKTPTSLYLALQYGVFTANYPLTDEDLETGKLPKALQPYVAKLYGLTIGAERLQLIRQERRPGSRYASPQQVRYEVRTALSLFERQGIPHLDVSECNVEEIASRILDRMNLKRRARG
ncbi:MAG TPA: pyruvate, water dikinase regulatory protein [Steroidobacteraceae bacterium]|nr:pyruvate, water dikinase regulatory protein [Steroidobacteraceae bacterium]